jgi:hypothetical protein
VLVLWGIWRCVCQHLQLSAHVPTFFTPLLTLDKSCRRRSNVYNSGCMGRSPGSALGSGSYQGRSVCDAVA